MIIVFGCRDGGIGRRAGLKIPFLYWSESSILSRGTKYSDLFFIVAPGLVLLFLTFFLKR